MNCKYIKVSSNDDKIALILHIHCAVREDTHKKARKPPPPRVTVSTVFLLLGNGITFFHNLLTVDRDLTALNIAWNCY